MLVAKKNPTTHNTSMKTIDEEGGGEITDKKND